MVTSNQGCRIDFLIKLLYNYYNKGDGIMKTKTDKKVNRITKSINKQLEKDVFKDRFWIRQYKKTKDNCNMQYYLFELCDRKDFTRNQICRKGWFWGDSEFLMKDLLLEMNNFIISSDFWATYQK